jgi:translation elongation factor P/translation initiation factor 5A
MDSQLRTKLDQSFNLIREIPLTKLRPLERTKKTVKDLKVGSVVKVEGIVYLITDKYTYYDKKKDVVDCVEFQLTDVLDNTVMYVEYTEDDEVEIYVTTKELTKAEIQDTLPQIDYQFVKNEVGNLTVAGISTTFYFEDHWKSRFVRDGGDLENSEVVKMVEFEAEDGESYLTFEYWGGETMTTFVSEKINSIKIEILAI